MVAQLAIFTLALSYQPMSSTGPSDALDGNAEMNSKTKESSYLSAVEGESLEADHAGAAAIRMNTHGTTASDSDASTEMATGYYKWKTGCKEGNRPPGTTGRPFWMGGVMNINGDKTLTVDLCYMDLSDDMVGDDFGQCSHLGHWTGTWTTTSSAGYYDATITMDQATKNSQLDLKFTSSTVLVTGDDFKCTPGWWGGSKVVGPNSTFPEDRPSAYVKCGSPYSKENPLPACNDPPQAHNGYILILPGFRDVATDPGISQAFFGTSGAGATSLQGKHKPGWCRNWLEIHFGNMPHFTFTKENCFGWCDNVPECEQAVFEESGPWGTECWLGGNSMTLSPAPSRDCTKKGTACVDHCYAKSGVFE
jgi:hypothetical protein